MAIVFGQDSHAQDPIVQGAEPQLVGPLLAAGMHDSRWAHCSVALIAGGKSNLTYRVCSDAGEVILRRPPLGHILPTAHDMEREYRVLSALDRSAVPVPRTLLLGGADSALGTSFYVMERVVGHICRDSLPPGYADTPADRAAIGAGLIEVLGALHGIDAEQVGLERFGRPDGFMERQLRRWSDQWRRSKAGELPELDALRDDLVATLPLQGRASIVHGDYRLDNTILHPTRAGEIVAVLDWEMSTLGDPLADFGSMLAYWAAEGDDEQIVRARMFEPVTALPGFPSRDELADRYARVTGFDLSALWWYEAFAYFKLAVICQGIATRAARGAMLGAGFEDAQSMVEHLVTAGRHRFDRVGRG